MEKLILSGFSDEIAESFDAQLDAVAEFGLSHIELRAADGVNVSDFSGEKVKEVKRKLRQRNIQVSSVGSPIGKIGIQEEFAPHLAKLERTLSIMEELEAPYLRMFSFYLPKGEPPEKYRDEVFRRMEQMVKLAEARGAVMLHENEKGIYGDNASRCRDLMEQFYGRHFQAVFDFANFVEVGQETLEAYELLKPYLAYIHIKDVSKALGKVVPAGKGDGKVREILSDLIGSGWRGFLSLEPHLVDFSGLKALEQNAAARNAAMDGKTAWKTALDALREILRTIPGAEEALE